MKNSKITTNKTNKEKEHALSLLRIPINFFEDDKKITKEDNEELKINTDTPSSATQKHQIKLDNNTSSIHLDIDGLELEEPTKKIKSKKTISSDSHEESNKNEKSNNEAETLKIQQSSSNEASEQEEANDTTSNQVINNTIPVSPPPIEEAEETNEPTEDTPSLAAPSPQQNLQPQNQQPANDIGPSAPSKSLESEKEADDTQKQKVDELKDKFGKTTAGKRAKGLSKKAKDKFNNSAAGKKINNAKDRISDTISKNPAASKALGAYNDTKKAVDSLKNITKEPSPEDSQALGKEVNKKAANLGATALTGGNKLAGDAAEKFVDEVSKTKLGQMANEFTGKVAFKSVKITCIGFLLIGFLLVALIFYTVTHPFNAITSLFSRDQTLYTDLSESDWEKLKEASEEYSMQKYTDLVIELNNPTKFADWFGTASDYPIQDAVEKYMKEYYVFTQDEADEYYRKYKKFIKDGYLIPLEVGDLTSFGMAFEMLKMNYSIHNLKAPSSAPERTKTINGKEVTYTTYDPTGIHQALFEDVLNNIDGLKTRFDGQVSKEWFDELNNMLDKSFPVYLRSIDDPNCLKDPSLIPTRTLRELFIETSTQTNDTEYYASLINIAFTNDNGINSEIVAEYNKLVDKLAMLELMTYTLSYQKFYNQIEVFEKNFENSQYQNAGMFNEEFFAQFLTFTNVEYYLALSNLADHSLTYEIAVASIESSINNIETTEITNGNKTYLAVTKFDNWFATYYLNPEIVVNGEDQISYTMVPTMNKTQTQQFLFDKYNVEADIFEGVERTKAQNQNSFFGAFELATGLDMAVIDDFGNEQTPIYYLNSEGMVTTTLSYLAGYNNFSGTVANGKSLPLSFKNAAKVSFAFGQTYSQATIDRFGWPDGKSHAGIDYSIPSGTDVFAAASGIAYSVPGNTGWGNYVKLVHDDGHVSYYAHGNGTFYISPGGQRVEAGQAIMQSGNSGNSTGAHLHFEVRDPSGKVINPNTYIST